MAITGEEKIELKEVETKTIVEKKNIKNQSNLILIKMNCLDYAIGALWAYEELLGPVSDAHGATIMNDAIAKCMGY